MTWIYGYVIEFADDDGPLEHQLGKAETEAECERIAALIPAVTYSGKRKVKSAILAWMPVTEPKEDAQ